MLAGAVAVGGVEFALASSGVGIAALPFLTHVMEGLVLGGISMEAGAIASALTSNRGTGVTIRQPAANRQIVRGIRRVGGVLVYTSTTGSSHDQYNAVIVLAGHEIDAIEAMYIDGRQVYFQGSGVGWAVRNGTGFGGIADSSDHVGPGGQTYNFGGTGHSGIYVEARYGDQTDPAGTNSPGKATWTGSPTSVIGGLTANDPNWGPDGLGNFPWLGGCAYVYVKLEYNTTLFPGGPAQAEIKFTVRGKNDIFDPRTGTRGYTSNWALQIADVLTDPTWGVGDIDGVNQDQLIAAANVCDEMVALANGNSELRYAVHWAYDSAVAPGDAIQNMMIAAAGRLSRVGGEWFIFPAYWQGPSFDFDQTALTGPVDWAPYRSFRELANRVNGTYIAANVPYNDAGNLYDSNGWYNHTILNNYPFGFQPTNFPQYAQDALHGYSFDALLSEDSGVLGAWDSATAYDADDVVLQSGVIYLSLLDGNLDNDPATHSAPGGAAAAWAGGSTYAAGDAVAFTQTSTGAYASGTTYSAGQGATFGGLLYVSLVGSNTGNQPDISPTDWAVVSALAQVYVSLVGSNTGHQPDIAPTDWALVSWVPWTNQLPLELDLNCVLSVAQAQRLAKITLLRNRQQGSGTFPLNLDAWQAMPLDVTTFEFPDLYWVGKQLEFVSSRFYLEQQAESQAIRFEAKLQETSAAIYEWTAAEELSVYDVPANPTGMPLSIAAPTSLTLLSDATTAVLGADGINHPRILASWTAPADVRVGQIQVQFRIHGVTPWTDAGTVSGGSTSMLISGVIAGDVYDVQIRSLANLGGTSAWVEVDNVTAAAPNSLRNSYTNAPALALTQPTSTTIHMAATAVTFGGATVNYAARTKTISALGSPTWLYFTIADATQAGESGSPTLVETISSSNALVGVQGNTYMGAILALPAGSAVSAIAGGWPAPQTVQVI